MAKNDQKFNWFWHFRLNSPNFGYISLFSIFQSTFSTFFDLLNNFKSKIGQCLSKIGWIIVNLIQKGENESNVIMVLLSKSKFVVQFWIGPKSTFEFRQLRIWIVDDLICRPQLPKLINLMKGVVVQLADWLSLPQKMIS